MNRTIVLFVGLLLTANFANVSQATLLPEPSLCYLWPNSAGSSGRISARPRVDPCYRSSKVTRAMTCGERDYVALGRCRRVENHLTPYMKKLYGATFRAGNLNTRTALSWKTAFQCSFGMARLYALTYDLISVTGQSLPNINFVGSST